jgi:4-amino-4-deoxy-L-arabinose transferase-like glycosyltransferase
VQKPQVLFALAILFLGLVTAAIIGNNGTARPIKGHEIFVAETASEMMARDDYLVPYYNGETRLQKPPLAYWLAIGFHRVFGEPGSTVVGELEARLASLISGVLVLMVTFVLGCVAFDDRRVGLLAAAILGTTWDFYAYSRSARPEMIYVLFCTIEVLALMIAAKRHAAGRSSLPAALLAWGAMAVALMAKGPQFPIFLLAGVALALWRRSPRPGLAKILHPGWGLALVALVLPYYVYLALHVDGAFAIWSREVAQNTPVPVWLRPFRFYYPWAVTKGMIPWLAVFGLGIVHCWKRRHPNASMMIWPILITLAILCFVGKLRPHYVLPLIPLCAVLSAWAAVELFDRARQDADAGWLLHRLLSAQAVLIGLLLLAMGWLASHVDPLTGLPMWPKAAPWLAGGAALAGLAFWLARSHPARTFGAMVLALVSVSMSISRGGLDISPYWATASEFATKVRKIVPADQRMIFQGVHSAALIYYGRRIGAQIFLTDWIKAHGTRDLPYLVCKNACEFGGHDIKGEVLLRQADRGQKRHMVLFKPDNATNRAEPQPAAREKDATGRQDLSGRSARVQPIP